jgi:hypothetical protein
MASQSDAKVGRTPLRTSFGWQANRPPHEQQLNERSRQPRSRSFRL